MSKLIQNLHIKNFKSVRDLSLDCDRINIFIGKPNAGKSNILEAISLLGAGYSEGRFMEGFIRYNAIYQLFSNYDTRKPIVLETDIVTASLLKGNLDERYYFKIEPNYFKGESREWEELAHELENAFLSKYEDHEEIDNMDSSFSDFLSMQTKGYTLQDDGKIINQYKLMVNTESPVKRYEFKPQSGRKGNSPSLTPPHGGNFYQIARTHLELREEIQAFLKPNGLELLLDEETKRVSILQREAASVLSFPLHLVPDTFQRYIFHLAAIMSNRDSVLLFEEPESHSYAPYIYQLAQHILDDEGGNQYFITTHNPYFLLPIMQEGKDVAVFATWFQDYQTHARRLSETEVREVLDYGVDVFLNFDHFIPE